MLNCCFRKIALLRLFGIWGLSQNIIINKLPCTLCTVSDHQSIKYIMIDFIPIQLYQYTSFFNEIVSFIVSIAKLIKVIS